MAEGLVISTNAPASIAVSNLASSNVKLKSSLERLSSGFKINSPSDDAGGLAVSMKMEAALKRNAVAQSNIANAISFLQTQDGAMSTIGKVIERISELKLLSTDVTKSTTDLANYDTEFTQLKNQLVNLQGEKFNGVSVFSGTANTTISVITSDDGAQSVNITKADVDGNNTNAVNTLTSAANLAAISVGATVNAINSIATLRAQNGAESNRLQFAAEMLVTNKINLEASNMRIKDTDVATETTKFAKYNILVQSGAAMLTQANSLPQIALQLLRG